MILIENVKGWGAMLDAFNQSGACQLCIKDGGKNIDKVLEKWILSTYDIPSEFIISPEEEYKHKVGYKQ